MQCLRLELPWLCSQAVPCWANIALDIRAFILEKVIAMDYSVHDAQGIHQILRCHASLALVCTEFRQFIRSRLCTFPLALLRRPVPPPPRGFLEIGVCIVQIGGGRGEYHQHHTVIDDLLRLLEAHVSEGAVVVLSESRAQQCFYVPRVMNFVCIGRSILLYVKAKGPRLLWTTPSIYTVGIDEAPIVDMRGSGLPTKTGICSFAVQGLQHNWHPFRYLRRLEAAVNWAGYLDSNAGAPPPYSSCVSSIRSIDQL